MAIHPVFLFLDISGGELLVIILVVFLVFGPNKMPEIARKIGKLMNEMKRASNDLTREFRQETTDIRNEVFKAQTKVSEDIKTVNQEISQTRARVVNDLTVPVNSEDEAKSPPAAPDIP
jgi:Tat protein translocase TatB subunit